jgi:glutathione S-transferase
LIPSSAHARALVQLFVSTFESSLDPVLPLILGSQKPVPLTSAAERLLAGLECIEGFLAAHKSESGSFFCGAVWSLAEVLTAPTLQRLLRLSTVLRPELLQHGSASRDVLLPSSAHYASIKSPAIPVPVDLEAEFPLLSVLRLRTPVLCRWACAVLKRASVAETFESDAVTALKARATATWIGSALEQPPPSRQDREQQLGALLVMRRPPI